MEIPFISYVPCWHLAGVARNGVNGVTITPPPPPPPPPQSVSCHWAIKSHPCRLGVNSSPPIATYMRQWTGSSLVQVMACRMYGAKPLPEPKLPYCQLDSWKQKWNLNPNSILFIQENDIWKCLPKWRPICAWIWGWGGGGAGLRWADRLILPHIVFFRSIKTPVT